MKSLLYGEAVRVNDKLYLRIEGYHMKFQIIDLENLEEFEIDSMPTTSRAQRSIRRQESKEASS